ncbi:MAG TPA: ATP-binding protein [Lacipirellulaceae bacterium]
MPDFEKPGSFYLGREHDLSAGQTQAKPLLYDASDLTTHAVCVGMTGSGKTGLCITLLEEAALDGIPAIAIDPKGDLGNLLLAFPDLAAADFRPWVDTSEAARRQMSPDEFAVSQAELWRNGLAKWDQGPDRIRRFCDAVDRMIYTPGSSAGIPITVLKSFRAPPKELLDDLDAFNERVASATSGLLALLGVDADPVRSREHIFLSNVLAAAWRAGKDLDLHELIQRIQRPPFDRVGVVDVESFYPAGDRNELAMRLNNLLASPGFAAWMQGEPLDVERLLYTPEGKPRLSIVSIAHLDDAQRMFFVTILLNEILSWIRTQPGTSSLRAILYMDEVFGYFPPLANPPAKRPMLTLLKQARAYGLGCVLATQNPVDLDYKGLSNAGTWFLGRLQTERDKARVIEGLEGASAEAGSGFDRQKMEATLAALGARVFLVNNVHDDKPIVFHTRWAMSYLCGPLTRSQIKKLMDPVRDRAGNAVPSAAAAAVTSELPQARRPILTAGIPEKFVRTKAAVADGDRIEYRPALVGHGKVHFVSKSEGIDVWRERLLLKEIGDMRPSDMWQGASVIEQGLALEEQPHPHSQFAALPSEFAREKSYSAFARSLRDHLYREQTLKRWRCESCDETSTADEEEPAFRARLAPLLNLRLQGEREKLEKAYGKKLSDADAKIHRAEARLSTQRWQFFARVGRLAWAVADTAASAIGRGLPGRRRSLDTALGSAATERSQQSNAQLNFDKAVVEKARLEQELQDKLAALDADFDAKRAKIEAHELKPQKSDIEVSEVSLVWLPFRINSPGNAEPIY